MSSIIEQDINQFNTYFKSESNFTEVIKRLKETASKFYLLDEENSLYGCFVTFLKLAEEYNHELLVGYGDKEYVLRN